MSFRINMGNRAGKTCLKKQEHPSKIQFLNKVFSLKSKTKNSKDRSIYMSFLKNFFIISLSFDIIS